MIHITIIDDPFDPDTWIDAETDDICGYLAEHFGSWPQGARLYHGTIADDHEVTPIDVGDVEALENLPGPFFVQINPGDPTTILIATLAGALLLTVGMFFLMPRPKVGNDQVQSGSNELTARSNKPRPLQRIPDILGTVRSTPDVLAAPIRIFESNKEVEYGYYCFGRGSYEITDVREDTTAIHTIDGSSVEIYGPNTSPLSGDEPEQLIGDAITQTLISVEPSSAINGQTMLAPNYKSVTGAGNIFFLYPDQVVNPGHTILWSERFETGDQITITNATYDDGLGHSVDLSGTYTVSGFTEDYFMTLSGPGLDNPDWTVVNSMTDNRTGSISPTIEVEGIDRWIGPFTLDMADRTAIYSNFVALGGLYKVDSKSNQSKVSVGIDLEVTPVDSQDNPIGSSQTFSTTITGSSVDKDLCGITLKSTTATTGRCSVRARRTTDIDYNFEGTVVDEVKWRDLYAVAPIGLTDFGNVTTVFTRTLANSSSLAQQNRKLNMLVTRKIPQRLSDNTFSTELIASDSVADIFCFASLDPYIGGRSLSELDVAQIYEEIDAVAEYFGTTDAIKFGYTFDDDNISAEEILAAIAQAAFCTAYRRGSLIQIHFEKATEDSTILFNHRNKLPGSETRTVSFGNLNDYDGVEYNYVDANDYDAPIVYRIPVDGSAVKPQKIDSIGIRDFHQAYWQAWRAFNKIKYQHVATEFTATQEACTVGSLERILVADNTRSQMWDGEVVSQNGLTLTLSQKVEFETGKTYRIFLQISSGSVDSIAIAPGSTANQIVLDRAPSGSLALDDDLFARTTYLIAADDDDRPMAFLVSQNEPSDQFTYHVSAVNYDARYYQNDLQTPN